MNKFDYIYESTQQYFIHCLLGIESDQSEKRIQLAPMPPTLISFIELQSIIMTPSEDLSSGSSSALTINFSLHNQFIELKAIRES